MAVARKNMAEEMMRMLIYFKILDQIRPRKNKWALFITISVRKKILNLKEASWKD